MNDYLTIRETAKLGIVSEKMLRYMVKQRKCPGFYVGTRFLVNVKLLEKALDEMSLSCGRENVKEKGGVTMKEKGCVTMNEEGGAK